MTGFDHHTEEEARKKWCPFTRALWDGAGANRVTTTTPTADSVGKDSDNKCVGSECMAWRFRTWQGPDGERAQGGWCGLAGNPWSLR